MIAPAKKTTTRRSVKAKESTRKIGERVVQPSFREKFYPQLDERLDPATVRGLLAGAFSGDPTSLHDLYVVMEDTWPRLSKNLHEIKKAASRAEYIVHPWTEQGEDPTPEAIEKADFLRRAIDRMRPVAKRNENGFQDCIYDLCDAIGKGVSLQEIIWKMDDGSISPSSSYWVHPQFWGFDHDGIELKLKNVEGMGWRGYVDIPDQKFLIGRYKTRSGNMFSYGFTRLLAFWWSGMIFGRKWLMQYAQIFGIPLRLGKYGKNMTDADQDNLEVWLRDLGAAGYAMIPEGADITIIEASKNGTDNPQYHLIDIADKICDILILGQTLTTDVADSGSRALGDVHAGVRQDNLKDACDWAAETINDQLVPTLIGLNFGNTDDLPFIQAKFESAEDPMQMAQRDQILSSMGMRLPEDQMYERHKIRRPDDDEDVLTPPSLSNPLFGREPMRQLPFKAKGQPGQNDALIDNVMSSLTGVAADWLGPVKPIFAQLISKAQDGSISDEEFVQAVEALNENMPELFDRLNHQSLQNALQNAMNASAINGAFERFNVLPAEVIK